MIRRHLGSAADSSIDILYRYSLAAPTPPSAGHGRGSEDGAGRSEKGFSPDFFSKNTHPIKVHPTTLLKRVVLEKIFFHHSQPLLFLRP